MAACKVCGENDTGTGGHNQPPPTAAEPCPKPGCSSTIKSWCPANHAKICWKGHRFIGNEEIPAPAV